MSGQAQHNLPRQMTSFVGRESEIDDILALLDSPNCQLLTLVGPGGVGKTRLAVEIARRKLDDFPDGVWYVPLQPLTSADQIATAIVKAIA